MPPMSEPKDLPALSREELLALVVELQSQIAEVRASDEALRGRSTSSHVVGSDRPPRFPGARGDRSQASGTQAWLWHVPLP